MKRHAGLVTLSPADHMRLEEQRLFPLIEQTLPGSELDALGGDLRRAGI